MSTGSNSDMGVILYRNIDGLMSVRILDLNQEVLAVLTEFTQRFGMSDVRHVNTSPNEWPSGGVKALPNRKHVTFPTPRTLFLCSSLHANASAPTVSHSS